MADTLPADDHGGSAPTGAIGIAIAVALSLFGDMAMYVILPISFQEIGITTIQVGILLSANRWIRLLTNRVAERVLRRARSGAPFVLALTVGSAIAALYALAPQFWILLVLRVSWGVCWSFMRHTGVMTTVGVAGSRPSRHLGVYVGFLQGGFVAGTFVAGVLFDAVGYRSALLIASALSLSALVPATAGLRRSTALSANREPPHLRVLDRGQGTLPTVLLLFRGFLAALVSAGLIMSTLGYLLKSRLGGSIELGGLTVGITTVSGVVLALQYVIRGAGSPLFGVLIDHLGLARSQVLAFFVAGLALSAAVIAGASWLLIVLVVVFFVAGATARLAVESEAAQAGGVAYANLASATDFGAALGPMLGWIGIDTASPDLVYGAGGLLLFLGAILAAVSWWWSSRDGSSPRRLGRGTPGQRHRRTDATARSPV